VHGAEPVEHDREFPLAPVPGLPLFGK
jgi:hypothetical protein